MLQNNLTVNGMGHLEISGVDSVYLAEKYGTPLYVLDEDMIREHMRVQDSALKRYVNEKSMILYASKALSFKEMYRIANEESIGVDVVSSGELYTALSVGFTPERIYFHGSSKTDFDISYGIDSRVGCFMVDNTEELERISAYAGEKGVTQGIMLRLTPGIDTHTFEAVNTGKVDSKFGVAIETGQAMDFTAEALNTPNVRVLGFHCHVGSQCFDMKPFLDAADIMLDFIRDVKAKFGYEPEILNLGGGLGTRYVESDPEVRFDDWIGEIGGHVKARCGELAIGVPAVFMEPGRSIVAAAGVTLYTVNSVKSIPGYKSYIAVDGGMGDNPRYALYESLYTALIANKADKPADFKCDLAGRCCESGDLIGKDMMLQRAERGDIAAVLVTGAYNYSMASNYNRVPRPAIVMLSGGRDRLVLRRETLADIVACDL